MQVVDRTYAPISFSRFAEQHGLVLEINERPTQPGQEDTRYYAKFQRVEVKMPGVLRGTFGNGRTKAAAVRAYADELAGETIVHNAYGPDRREIQCPNTWRR